MQNMSGKIEEIQFVWTYIKSFVIVCEPLARALNSTPVKSTDLGCFHSISFPLKQGLGFQTCLLSNYNCSYFSLDF